MSKQMIDPIRMRSRVRDAKAIKEEWGRDEVQGGSS